MPDIKEKKKYVIKSDFTIPVMLGTDKRCWIAIGVCLNWCVPELLAAIPKRLQFRGLV